MFWPFSTSLAILFKLLLFTIFLQIVITYKTTRLVETRYFLYATNKIFVCDIEFHGIRKNLQSFMYSCINTEKKFYKISKTFSDYIHIEKRKLQSQNAIAEKCVALHG